MIQPMSDLPKTKFDFDNAFLRAHAEALERTYLALEPGPLLRVPRPNEAGRMVAAGKYIDGVFTIQFEPAWGGAK